MKQQTGSKRTVRQQHEDNLSFICFGGLDWWYQHKSHVDFQLIRRFARKGPAVYINSIVMQKPNLTEGRKFLKKVIRKTKSIFTGLRHTNAGFWVYSPFSLPVHHILWARGVNEVLVRRQVCVVASRLGIRNPVIMVVCPAACDMALGMKKRNLIYLRTDAYELFPNVETEVVREYDRRLRETADITLYVSRKLYEDEASGCKNSLYLDHGVDYELFASAKEEPTKPLDLKEIKEPIIGFFGTLDSHTVDVDLIAEVADLLPHMSFVFIGKIAAKYQCIIQKDNIYLLGQKPYEKVPHYGKCFDVAIMPWRQTAWIQVCNPIKLKEYLALGKPIVSTPFTELQKYKDVVYQADTPEKFAKCVEKALAEDNPERVAARRKKVETSTWDSKAQLVLEELFGKER
ncbi:MAG: glycosyltransferase [Planctomycetota bacterium]|jgi:glycosyltransferase involved in cell wall biosynthesis